MLTVSRLNWLIPSAALFALLVAPCDPVFAQEEVTQTIEEIVTIGTRRAGRVSTDTAVPVDVFNLEDIQSVASDDMVNVIEALVPSYIVVRFPISDGRTFIRPPRIRGMSADKTLVLINGKRRHRSALVFLGANGSHGPDVATLPSIGLKSIEVLRDGASALYGSDAIAGVLNFNLRDDAEGGELRIQSGEYAEGDGRGYQVALNAGFSLGANGFINISAELADNDPTSRGVNYMLPISGSGLTPSESALVSGLFDHDLNPATPDQMRYGPDALTEVYDPATGALVTLARGSDGVPDDTDTRYADNLEFAEISPGPLVQIWGSPRQQAIRSFINAGLDLDNGVSLYGWANYSDSDGNGGFFHRRPGIGILAPLRTASGDIYDPRDRYPAGFTPRFSGHVIDMSVTGGVTGEWNNGMSWDVSGRWGDSRINYTIFNTMNASLGPATPTEFRPGGLVTEESAFNADFAIPVDVGWSSDLNIAFGTEYRNEGYEIVQGDPLSYAIGPYAFADPWNFEIDADEAAAGQNGGSVGCFIPGPQFNPTALCDPRDPIHNTVDIGSNGFPGYGPTVVSTYDRNSWAAYFDLEADVTDRFLATIAGRYEDFSDFGSNFSFRLAARLRLGESWSVRGSAGTGFRAPTPGQISTTNVATGINDDGQPLETGVFPATHPVSQYFGAVPLTDETSKQLTVGVTFQPTDRLAITLDYYRIDLKDQIYMSSDFDLEQSDVAALLALGVPEAAGISSVRFFTNDIDTETSGLDLVANYLVDWTAGNTVLQFAANYNHAQLARRTNHQTDPNDPTPIYYFDDGDAYFMEHSNPRIRANLTARHTWSNDITASVRASWYGDYKFAMNSAVTAIQEHDGKMYWDVDLTWDVDERLSLTIGADNVFDEYPDPSAVFPFVGAVYRAGDVLDWQGAYYFARGVLRWD